MLAAQAAFVADNTPGKRQAVIAAAQAFTIASERGAREEPKTIEEIALLQLAGQQETNRLLAALIVSDRPPPRCLPG